MGLPKFTKKQLFNVIENSDMCWDTHDVEIYWILNKFNDRITILDIINSYENEFFENYIEFFREKYPSSDDILYIICHFLPVGFCGFEKGEQAHSWIISNLCDFYEYSGIFELVSNYE